MKMTTDDLITHLKKVKVNYDVTDDCYIHVHDWVSFCTIPKHFTSLPNNVIFDRMCDFDDSPINEIPNNIVLHGSLSMSGSKITSLPETNPLYIPGILYIHYSNITIPFGTYIGSRISVFNTRLYEHYKDVETRGYFVMDGILS